MVAVMDDDTIFQIMLRQYIERKAKVPRDKALFGCTMLELEKFFDDISKRKPGEVVFVVDHGLPNDLTGMDVIRQIRSFEKEKSVPCAIIGTSGSDNEEVLIDSGADVFYPKPDEVLNFFKRMGGQFSAVSELIRC